MPPKLSADQIQGKLVEIRQYVRAHLPNLVARGSTSLKATFGGQRDKRETAFYLFLYKSDARFTEAQRNYADETFALLTQFRESSGVNTRAETGSSAASSTGLRRDRSRSVRRRTVSASVTSCDASQLAILKRRRDDPAVSLPPLDASIIEEVEKLGRHPMEIWVREAKEFTSAEKAERSLARKIRWNFSKLSTSTISYLTKMKLEYKWIADVVEAREKRRVYHRRFTTKSKDHRLRELRRRLELMSQVQPYDVLKHEKFDNSKVTDWWSAAGICEKPMVPKWCFSDDNKSSTKQVKTSLWEMHYHLSHHLLQEVDAFWDCSAGSVVVGGITQRLYSDFFASCRSLERRMLEPYPARLDLQCRYGIFMPHQCLRQLALIELTNMTLQDIPLSLLPESFLLVFLTPPCCDFKAG